MTEATRATTRYKTTNWPQYNAALKARGSLTIWFERDMQWFAAPSGKRGRQHLFSDACIQFCLSIKCLFNLPLRQSLGLVQSLLKLAQLGLSVKANGNAKNTAPSDGASGVRCIWPSTQPPWRYVPSKSLTTASVMRRC